MVDAMHYSELILHRRKLPAIYSNSLTVVVSQVPPAWTIITISPIIVKTSVPTISPIWDFRTR